MTFFRNFLKSNFEIIDFFKDFRKFYSFEIFRNATHFSEVADYTLTCINVYQNFKSKIPFVFLILTFLFEANFPWAKISSILILNFNYF